MAKKPDKSQRLSKLVELSPDELAKVVGGTGGAAPATTTGPKDEQTFVNNLQTSIDQATESASAAVTAAQNYATQHGMMEDQVLVDLGKQLAGSSPATADHQGTADKALGAIENQLATDITGTAASTTTSGDVWTHNIVTTQHAATGMAVDAAHALAGQAGLNADAATVENMLAGAAALTGQSDDALLGQVAGTVHAHGDNLTANTAQFMQDVEARVSSGEAATGLAADIAAGHITGTAAVAALGQEAAATGLTPTQADIASLDNAFVGHLQQQIDQGTESAANAVTDAQAFAAAAHLASDQVLVNLGQDLAGAGTGTADHQGTADAALAAVVAQLSTDITGTAETWTTTGNPQAGNLVVTDHAATGMLVDAAHALEGQAGLNADAATVEHTLAGAAALTGQSEDALLGRVAGAVHAQGDTLTASTAQFVQDVQARVSSGEAATGLAADIAAGRISGTAAIAALDQEATAAGLTPTQADIASLETAFVGNLQQRIDQGTESAANVVADAQAFAAAAHLASDQVLVDLGQNLAGTGTGRADHQGTADAALVAVVAQLSTDVTGTAETRTTTGDPQAGNFVVTDHAATGMLVDAAHALQGQAGLSGDAAGVEHMLAGAAALTGRSDDALLGQLGQTLGAVAQPSAATTAFLGDLQSHVASGAAATALAADIVSGTLTAQQAMDALGAEVGASHGALEQQGVALLNALSGNTHATPSELSALTGIVAASMVTAHGFAGETPAQATADIAAYVAALASHGSLSARASIALAEAAVTTVHGSVDATLVTLSQLASGDPAGGDNATALVSALHHEIATRIATGPDGNSIAGHALAAALAAGMDQDAVLDTLAAEAKLGTSGVASMSEALANLAQYVGVSTEAAFYHAAIQAQGAPDGQAFFNDFVQRVTSGSALWQLAMDTAGYRGLSAQQASDLYAAEQQLAGVTAVPPIEDLVRDAREALLANGEPPVAAAIVEAAIQTVATACGASVDAMLGRVAEGAHNVAGSAGGQFIQDLATRVSSGTAAAALDADLVGGRITVAEAVGVLAAEGHATGIAMADQHFEQMQGGIWAALRRQIDGGQETGAQLIADVSAYAGKVGLMPDEMLVALGRTLSGAHGTADHQGSADAVVAAIRTQLAQDTSGSHASLMAEAASMLTSGATTAPAVEHMLAGAAALTGRSYDGLLVQVAAAYGSAGNLAANAAEFVENLQARVTSGAAAAALGADVLSGALDAHQAIQTYGSEYQIAHPGTATMSVDQQGFALLNALATQQASPAELLAVAGAVAANLVAEHHFGSTSWAAVGAFAETLVANGTLGGAAAVALAEATATAADTSVDLTLVSLYDAAVGAGPGTAISPDLETALQAEMATRIASGAAATDLAAAFANGTDQASMVQAIAREATGGTTTAADLEATLVTLSQAVGVSTEAAFYQAAMLGGSGADQSAQFAIDYQARVESGAAVSEIIAELTAAHPTITLASAVNLVEAEASLTHTDADVALVALLPHDAGTNPVAAAISARLAEGSVVDDMVAALQSGNIGVAAAQATLQAIGGNAQLTSNPGEITLVTDVVATLGTQSQSVQAAAFLAAESAALGGQIVAGLIAKFDAGPIDHAHAVTTVETLYNDYVTGMLPAGVTMGQAYESLVAAESNSGGQDLLFNAVAGEIGADVDDQTLTGADAVAVLQAIGTSLGQPIENVLVTMGEAGDTGTTYNPAAAATAALRAEYTSGMGDGSGLVANVLGYLANGQLDATGAEALVRGVAQFLGYSGEQDIAHLLTSVSSLTTDGFNLASRLTAGYYGGGDDGLVAQTLNALNDSQAQTLVNALVSLQANIVNDVNSGAEATRIVQEWNEGFNNVPWSGEADWQVKADMSMMRSAAGMTDVEGGIVQLAQAAAASDVHSTLTTALEAEVAQRVNSGAAIDQVHADIDNSEARSGDRDYTQVAAYQAQVASHEMSVYAQEVEIAARYDLEQQIVGAKGDADLTATVAQELGVEASTAQGQVLMYNILNGTADAAAIVHDPAYAAVFTSMDKFAELGLAKMAWDAGQITVLNADGSVDPYANPIGGLYSGQTYAQPGPDHGEGQFLESVIANTNLINDVLSALGADAATNVVYASRDAAMITAIAQDSGFAGTAPAGTPAGDSPADTNLGAAQARAESNILDGLGKLAVIHAVVGAVEAFEGSKTPEGFVDMADAAAQIYVRGIPLLGLADGLATKLANETVNLVTDAIGGESGTVEIESLLKSAAGDDAGTWLAGGAIEVGGAGLLTMAIMGVSVLDAFVDSKYGSWMGSDVTAVMDGLNMIGTDINTIINDVVTGAVDLTVDVAKDIGSGLGDLFAGNAQAAGEAFESIPGDVLGVLNETLNGIFTTLESLGDTHTAYNSPEGIFGSKY